MPPDEYVTFTVKELLADLNRKMDNIDNKLENKADRMEVMNVATRVGQIEGLNLVRLIEDYRGTQREVVELRRVGDEAIGVAKYRKVLIGTLIAFGGLILAASGLILAHLH